MFHPSDQLGHPESEPPATAAPPAGRAHDEAIAKAVAALRAEGRPVEKIAVIKGLRERTSVGLKEAKDAVEDYGRRHRIDALVRYGGDGSGLVFGLALILLAALGAWLAWGLIR